MDGFKGVNMYFCNIKCAKILLRRVLLAKKAKVFFKLLATIFFPNNLKRFPNYILPDFFLYNAVYKIYSLFFFESSLQFHVISVNVMKIFIGKV